MKHLKYVRITLAALMLAGITALLLDATGTMRHWLGWMPKVQLLPAALALNVAVVVAIAAVTLLVGRIYCSVICPLGIFQDVAIRLRLWLLPKRKFSYAKPINWLRYVVLALFAAMMLLGAGGIATLIAPYGAFGRMVTGLFQTGVPLAVAVTTLVVIVAFSVVGGRLWCNTFCPVGSALSLISRHSLFGIGIDSGKCIGCRKCERACKAMCIDIEGGRTVDRSRCVDCMDCLGECKVGAIGIGRNTKKQATEASVDDSRRRFVAGSVAVGTAMAVRAQEQKLDGGLAAIADKQVPLRKNPVKPFGARSLKNFSSRCVSCQLCVGQCPEHVLRPATGLERFMQPEMDYTVGYCRMACTRCSEVCPAGAIGPISKEEKTAVSIGYAVVLKDNCIGCGTCARHCPSAAISMVEGLPAVNESRCLGCGACEYYCPARPVTAIYVEGRTVHTEI